MIRVVLAIGIVLALQGPASAGVATTADERPRAAATKFDDRELQRKGRWHNAHALKAYKKTLSRSTDKGARLTAVYATSDGGTLTVQRGPARGTIDILVGGKLAKTVKTSAKKTGFKTVKFKGSGEVTLKVRSPKAGVYVDALTLEPVRVQLGQGIIVTEWLSEPTNLQPELGEWVELHNTNTVDVAVTGCTVSNEASASVVLPAATLPPGGRFVLARNADPSTNGGVSANATLGFALSPAGSLTFACAGTVFDTVTWSLTTEGATASLDPDFYDPVGNDTISHFCLGSTPYGTGGDSGSPGAPNPQCP